MELRGSSPKYSAEAKKTRAGLHLRIVRVRLPPSCCLDGLRSQSLPDHTGSYHRLTVSNGGRPLVQVHLMRTDTVRVVSGRRAPGRTLTCPLRWCSCQLAAAMLLRLHAMLVPCTAFWVLYYMHALRLSSALPGFVLLAGGMVLYRCRPDGRSDVCASMCSHEDVGGRCSDTV